MAEEKKKKKKQEEEEEELEEEEEEQEDTQFPLNIFYEPKDPCNENWIQRTMKKLKLAMNTKVKDNLVKDLDHSHNNLDTLIRSTDTNMKNSQFQSAIQ